MVEEPKKTLKWDMPWHKQFERDTLKLSGKTFPKLSWFR